MRSHFASKVGVVLATAGSAVGLGNIWRFPTEVGNNGGAAFIIVYIACVAFFGLPLMLSEFVIGRRANANAAEAFNKLAPGTQWRRVGQMGIGVAWMLICYYCVVAGWTLYYLVKAIIGGLAAAQDFKAAHSSFMTDPWLPVLCLAAFMLITHLIVVRGVQRGLERSSRLMMPLLLGIILVLVVCSFSMPGSHQAMRFLFKPDFAKIDGGVVLSALGQAFYSLSLGAATLLTYASYFRKDVNLVRTAANVSIIDTLVAVTAGLIIFPAVFSDSTANMQDIAGPDLVFVTLPGVFQHAFGSVPVLGYIFAVVFYLLLFLAALTSAISLHEVPTVYISERFNIRRSRSALVVTAVCIVVGCLCSLSFGVLGSDEAVVMADGTTQTQTVPVIFNFFNDITAEYLMPIGGMLTCIFIGWYLDRRITQAELTNNGALRFRLFRAYIFIVRWIAPTIIAVIFVQQIFFK